LTTPARKRAERKPETCIFEITHRCNLRCVHCGNDSGEPSPRELSREQLRTAARELKQLGCEHVEVTGGEPLLHADWAGVCGDFASAGLRVAIITNGTLLDGAHLDRALHVGVAAVGLSLDGLQATHDRIRVRPATGPSPWQQTVAAIERCLARVETIVITCVCPQNLGELPAMRTFLQQLGVKRWQIQLVIPAGRALTSASVIAPRDLDALTAFLVAARADGLPPRIDASDTIGYYTERELGFRGTGASPAVWTGCQAGIRAVAITCDGRVRGCSLLPPEFDAGDLHDEPLSTIWQDEERFAYTTRFDAHNLAGGCAHCKVGPLCRAGCTTMAYWTTGSIYSNPYCLSRVRGASS
jgi:radical SAM protein with 4Fe4S-binding SPASM domain